MPYDLDNIYSFWCARYRDMSIEEFYNIRESEFKRKINSIPENEPLYKIIQSRVIDLAKIKNKEERKYWRDLKKINRIPDEYISNYELDERLKESLRNGTKFR